MTIEKVKEFVVPIIIDGKFMGTGFLVDKHLFTAIHVIEKTRQFSYVFKNNVYNVVIEKNEYLDSFEELDGNTNDLFICEVQHEPSPLSFSYIDIKGKECTYLGYSPIENKRYEFVTSNVTINTTNRHTSKSTKRGNCVESIQACLVGGNSGGPIVYEGKVVGMLISTVFADDSNVDIFITSHYIQTKLLLHKKM